MNANLNMLNAINQMLVKVANENGIDLAVEFGTPEKFKTFVISFSIKSVMDIAKVNLVAAYDMVMGTGAYEQMANQVWEQLQHD